MRPAPPAVERHLFLSPHLDDAALSAGGTIHRLTARGLPVTVVTICAGAPPEATLSAYALSLHARWGQSPDEARHAAAVMVALRRAEDRAACRRLGADCVHLRLPDLIYRRRANGAWAAESDADLFAGAAGVDTGTVAALAGRLGRWLRRRWALPADRGPGGPRFWAPLGIGDHVDHHLCRQAVERLATFNPKTVTLGYYEDYPYAGDARARAKALNAAPAEGRWRASPQPIDAADLAAKLDAIACFGSQISSFWTDETAMRAAVTDFSRADGENEGWSERFWQLAE
ncbi:MAG: PIG-L family deacetylase [Ardenticatenia bacterium]|nr:PIG-L family deacetylase [Ardenticatenia bacterium]